MSTYDSYEVEVAPRKHKHRHHHRDRDDDDDDRSRDVDPEPRYVETRETYVRLPASYTPESPYGSRATEIIRRPVREDSDLSVEEVRRDFPPPGAAGVYMARSGRDDRYDRYGPPVRSRSAERDRDYGQYLDDPRDERRTRKKIVKEEIVEPRRRSLSRNQKILAGVAGAALAVGGKEIWERRKNHGQPPEERNILATAAVGAAGAFAGYEGAEFAAKHIPRGEKKVKDSTYVAYEGRNGNVAEYYSSDDDHNKKDSRRKSIIEGALGLAGIGAAAKVASSGHRDRDDDRSDRRSRRGSEESTRTTRSKRHGGDSTGPAKFQQAAKAALLAGAAEAFRVRKEPGSWTGAKGKRILTAAIGAGGIDAAADRDPEKHGKRHILEAVLGGLAGNYLINGSKKELENDNRDGRGGRSRSRSRAPSSSGLGGAGLAALATAGLGALAGKKLLDRSRSRGGDDDDRDDRRSRRRDDSEDSYDNKKNRRRSQSVGDFARKGLAALGLGEAAEAGRDDRRRDRDREVVEETHVTRRTRRSRDSDDSDDYDDRRDNRRDDRRDDRRSDRRDDRRDYDDSRGDRDGDDRDARRGGGGESRRDREASDPHQGMRNE